jgi:hypothetical protein
MIDKPSTRMHCMSGRDPADPSFVGAATKFS